MYSGHLSYTTMTSKTEGNDYCYGREAKQICDTDNKIALIYIYFMSTNGYKISVLWNLIIFYCH